jgi:hypothetical protein
MGLISRLYNFVSGTVIDSEQVDAELNQILAVLNGGIDSANVTDGSLALADLATATKNSFLKLATVADKKIAFGSYFEPAGWSGTDHRTDSISHGLGSTPSVVLLTAGAIDGTTPTVVSLTGKAASTFSYYVASADGSVHATGTIIDWIAIS